MIEAVTIAGTPWELGHVLADVTIRHGRGAWGEAPNASSASITLYDAPPALPGSVAVGHPLVLSTGSGAVRFTGRVTDAVMSFPHPFEGATIALTAVGNLADLGRRLAGKVDYPSERGSARAARIATDADAPPLRISVPTAHDYMVAARPAKPETALALLTELATTLGAVLSDLPSGEVALQSLHARPLADPVEIPAAAVKYAPTWRQAWEVENSVRVKWQGGEVVEDDPASVALWGTNVATIETTLATSTDAHVRALDRLVRRATPRWQLPEAVTTLGPDALPVSPGSLVIVAIDQTAGLPLPGYSMVVEGWTDTQRGDEWTTTLHLSDGLMSFAGLAWEDIPATAAAYTWGAIKTPTEWRNALTLSDLKA